MERHRIYLDHNATTPLHPEVRRAMTGAMDIFGNPSSLHAHGREAADLIAESRREVADLIGASAGEVVFVGSGSEANNTVLNALTCEKGACARLRGDRRGLVTTAIEHPCVMETARCLSARGVPVEFAPVDELGRLRMDALEDLVHEGVAMVSVMLANNETGTLQDLPAVSEICRRKDVLLHCDAVQAVGKVPVDVEELGVDFLTISAHKIYGPKGVGALYVRSGRPFCPLIRGGHQEDGRRAGTENTLGIVGLAEAVRARRREMEDEHARMLRLRRRLLEGLGESIPDFRVNGHPEQCIPAVLNLSFPGAEGESILLYLDLEGIEVSTGSACASGSLDPSHVLQAMRLPEVCLHGSVRISMGRGTTDEDIDRVVEVLPATIERIRGMSTIRGEK
jgi:cysteine desulfurase